MGIQVTEAGSKHIHLSPDLMGLQFVKGGYPTKYGKVEVSYERYGKQMVLKHLKIPKKCGLSMDKNIVIDKNLI